MVGKTDAPCECKDWLERIGLQTPPIWQLGRRTSSAPHWAVLLVAKVLVVHIFSLRKSTPLPSVRSSPLWSSCQLAASLLKHAIPCAVATKLLQILFKQEKALSDELPMFDAACRGMQPGHFGTWRMRRTASRGCWRRRACLPCYAWPYHPHTAPRHRPCPGRPSACATGSTPWAPAP